MDILYKVDYKLCSFLRKYCSLHTFSFESVFMRYVKRLSKDINFKQLELKKSNYIWVFWAQGEKNMPDIIKRCYNTILMNGQGYDVVLLDMDSIKNYVKIPDIIYDKLKKGKMSYTHFSDVLRFELLKKYGGWWVDSTIFLISPLPQKDTSFWSIKQKYNESCISRYLWTTFLLYMPANHPLSFFISNFLYSYWKANDMIIDYLLLDYGIKYFYDHNIAFRKEIDDIKESNPDLYFFQTEEALSKFQKKRWDEIIQDTYIFKTTYKKGLESAPSDSYCRRLLFE